MSGCVTVTGPPASICFWKIGTTLPLEPRTLPKRTATKRVRMRRVAAPCHSHSAICTYSSATRFVAPITRLGFTALSVLTSTNAWASRGERRRRRRSWCRRRCSDRLAGVELHHRDVLVRGAVEDDLRLLARRRSARPAGRRRRRRGTGRTSAPSHASRSSRSISNRLFSARSSSSMRCGQNRIACRQISDPMLPPAPVTSTRLPARNRCNSGVSRLTGGPAEQVGQLEATLATCVTVAGEDAAERAEHAGLSTVIGTTRSPDSGVLGPTGPMYGSGRFNFVRHLATAVPDTVRTRVSRAP